jgi:hypothetical protein
MSVKKSRKQLCALVGDAFVVRVTIDSAEFLTWTEYISSQSEIIVLIQNPAKTILRGNIGYGWFCVLDPVAGCVLDMELDGPFTRPETVRCIARRAIRQLADEQEECYVCLCDIGPDTEFQCTGFRCNICDACICFDCTVKTMKQNENIHRAKCEVCRSGSYITPAYMTHRVATDTNPQRALYASEFKQNSGLERVNEDVLFQLQSIRTARDFLLSELFSKTHRANLIRSVQKARETLQVQSWTTGNLGTSLGPGCELVVFSVEPDDGVVFMGVVDPRKLMVH